MNWFNKIKDCQKQYAKWKKKGKTNLWSRNIRLKKEKKKCQTSGAAVTKINQQQKQDNGLK